MNTLELLETISDTLDYHHGEFRALSNQASRDLNAIGLIVKHEIGLREAHIEKAVARKPKKARKKKK